MTFTRRAVPKAPKLLVGFERWWKEMRWTTVVVKEQIVIGGCGAWLRRVALRQYSRILTGPFRISHAVIVGLDPGVANGLLLLLLMLRRLMWLRLVLLLVLLLIHVHHHWLALVDFSGKSSIRKKIQVASRSPCSRILLDR